MCARVRAGDGGRRASRILNVSFALDSPFSRAADADEGNGAAWQVWEKGTGRVRRQAGWVYSGREGKVSSHTHGTVTPLLSQSRKLSRTKIITIIFSITME